ncbi:kinase-like protein [Podospora australis]|uniref:Kinase-like protein n=1 Tax=Podospora australis TaxID=1536484 RepID=A0AAN6WPN0_9PEZI|nr:kinase-like protein [Podospora australis]
MTAETTESQGWDGRFDELSSGSAWNWDNTSSKDDDRGQRMRDILSAVRNELTFVQPQYLKFYSHLGRGNSFEVNKELFSPTNGPSPYFVAVKRILVRDGGGDGSTAPAAMPKPLTSVLREVRVLTHAKLRSHACFVAAQGWGWTTDPSQPYLVMEYSDRGTLRHFSGRLSIPQNERRLLTLDVASGLRALHDCGIVHGDVKPDNVLVFDQRFRDMDHDGVCVAKLADFGCTLFEEDIVAGGEYYLGTPKYNAPEICGRQKDGIDYQVDRKELSKFEEYKAADCYSFGLLLCEAVKHGQSFIEPSWLKPGETAEVGVYIVNATHPQIANFVDAYPHARGQLQAIGGPDDVEVFQVLQNTVSLCLQDNPRHRGGVREIVRALSQGVSDHKVGWGSSTVRFEPHDRLVNDPATVQDSMKTWLMHPRESYQQSVTLKGICVGRHGDGSAPKGLTLRAVPKFEPADPSLQMVAVPAIVPTVVITVTPEEYHYGPEDMFKAARSTQPPWDNQREAAEHVWHAAGAEKSLKRKAQAQFQLAIMHEIGYGVAPDHEKALQHLADAGANKVAREIDSRLQAEFSSNSHWVVLHRREPGDGNEDITLSLGSISVASYQVLAILVKRGRYEPAQLMDAFTAACREGLLDAAMLLAKHCRDISSANANLPNPLHWLIVFTEKQAVMVLEAFVSGPKGSEAESRSQGIQTLLASGHDQTTVLLPHRCMELQGTPLHWAVTAGYANLVSALIQLGADVNARTKLQRDNAAHNDTNGCYRPSLSPLDLAVAYHFPNIIKLLLDKGSETYGGDWYWKHSPFHMIGYKLLPFARFVAHGRQYKAALHQTIQVLLAHGLSINQLDGINQTPLLCEVKNIDLERYILEQLIACGAKPGEEFELLMPLVPDINACHYGDRGMSALHLCAILNAGPAAKVLLGSPGIDIDHTSVNDTGVTALSFAARKGCIDVLAALIHKGANVNCSPALGEAIAARQVDAAVMLVEAGAGVWIETSNRAMVNILHLAVAMDETKPSHIKKLLSKSYFGDVKATGDLLEAGTDPWKFKLHPECSLGGSPLEVASKILRRQASGALNLHPRVRPQIDHAISVLKEGNPVFDEIRRVKSRFVEHLNQTIALLQRAERETPKPAMTYADLYDGSSPSQEVMATDKDLYLIGYRL